MLCNVSDFLLSLRKGRLSAHERNASTSSETETLKLLTLQGSRDGGSGVHCSDGYFR